ncbi:MAG: acyltransferase [Bacteroidota bacterium]
MNKIFRYVPHIWKSLVFNLHYFPFLIAIRLPVLIHRKVMLKKLDGRLHLKSLRTGTIKIGFSGSEFSSDRDGSVLNIQHGADVELGENIFIGRGSRLSVRGKLSIGNNLMISMNGWILCEDKITIKDNVLISWGTQILDSDQHSVLRNGTKTKNYGPIEIGNHVWITNKVSILKNSIIPDGTIIGTGSVVRSEIKGKNCLVAGNPAIIVSENIQWNLDER